MSLLDRIGGWARRPWKVLGLSVVPIVVLTLIVYSYSTYLKPQSTLYVTATSPPLELRMELDKTEFQQGEKVVVRLFLKNIGSETITISFTYWNDEVGFIVKDENDKEVYIHPETFLTAVKKVDLGPSGQISETFEWSQIGNRPENYGVSVPMGTYEITGRTGRFRIVGKTSPRGRIETPAIAITIG